MLAGILGRDGQALSASQAWRQELADADHLAVLNAIWTAETSPARDQRYRDLLTAALPPGWEQEAPGHRDKWLWKTLHAAELAGLDARHVLAAAVAERDLAGARDLPAVVDSRIRRRAGALVPLPAPAWSQQVPEISDPGRRAYLAEVAALMDARKERIGVHAASALPWAVGVLGPVPDDLAGRLEWRRKAASAGAYRELSGYDDPADPVGPEPAANNPDLRAAWHEALAALGPAGGPDVRGMTDGLLLRLRDTYPVENRLGAAVDRRPAPPGPYWRPGRPPGSTPRHRRSRRGPPPRRA